MKRAGLLAGLAAIILLTLAGYLWWSRSDPGAPVTVEIAPEPSVARSDPAAPAQPASPVERAAPISPTEPDAPSFGPPSLDPPSFDIVRVEPSGEAVLAGRAAPGSTVILLDGGTAIAKVTANPDGEWVIVLGTALAPGSHELSLESRPATGEVLRSGNVVIVSVPTPAAVAEAPVPPAAPATEEAGAIGRSGAESVRPLVVLMPRTGQGPIRIIQEPEPVPSDLGHEVLLLETVDYDRQGRAVLGGRGKAGVVLILYLDGRPAGRAAIGPDGRWRARLDGEVALGVHVLRVDQVDESGRVVARVESPFSRAEIMTAMAGETAVIVQPGNSLWRIARRIYGEGVRYSVIYRANRDRIRDPDLIYPGQVFAVPKAN